METIETPIKGIRDDLFAAIKYERRRTSGGVTEVGLVLPRRFVLKESVKITWRYCSAGILVANRYVLHTTESLFNDPTAWDVYADADHRDFGRVVAFFANQPIKLLPLHCTNPLQSNKLYQIIG